MIAVVDDYFFAKKIKDPSCVVFRGLIEMIGNNN
jgi:hypothetical protein